MMMLTLFVTLLLALCAHCDTDLIWMTGTGYHRTLHVNLRTSSEHALLKWEITPDFYVDVYELKRLGFDFRVDNGDTAFIEIEEPAHRSSFHSLSLNIQQMKSAIPFHLRYQPATYSDNTFPYASILVPAPELHFIDSNQTLTKLVGNPEAFNIPIGNRHHTVAVDVVTLLTVFLGTAYLARVIINA